MLLDSIYFLILIGLLTMGALYFSMRLVLRFKQALGERGIYSLVQIALGMMLCHFALFPMAFYEDSQLSSFGKSTTFVVGFLLGAFVLMFYASLKEAIFEGPKDLQMMEEFGHKNFFADPQAVKGIRYNVFSLRYDLAICYGLHALGGGLLFAHHLGINSLSGCGEAFNQLLVGDYSTIALALLMLIMAKGVEGMSIAAIVSSDTSKKPRLLFLGLLAGLPFFFGVWFNIIGIGPVWVRFWISFSAGSLFYCLVMMVEMVSMTHRENIPRAVPIARILLSFSFFFILHQV